MSARYNITDKKLSSLKFFDAVDYSIVPGFLAAICGVVLYFACSIIYSLIFANANSFSDDIYINTFHSFGIIPFVALVLALFLSPIGTALGVLIIRLSEKMPKPANNIFMVVFGLISGVLLLSLPVFKLMEFDKEYYLNNLQELIVNAGLAGIGAVFFLRNWVYNKLQKQIDKQNSAQNNANSLPS